MRTKSVLVETTDGTRISLSLKWKKDLSEGMDLLEVHLIEKEAYSSLFTELINTMVKNKIGMNTIKSITFPEAEVVKKEE